jgi:hypothetical protein
MRPANDEPDPGADGDAVREVPPHPQRVANRIVPDAVARRFPRVGDQYFFPDRTLAFVDAGTRLRVLSHDLEVLHGIVAIVQARGWQALQVTGAPAFRRQLWREATLQGLDIRGHEPDAQDREEVGRALARGPADMPPSAAQRPPAGAASPGTVRDGLRSPVAGVLLAHAAAPYRFDPAQGLSYYARIRTEAGERTVWGADLERAIAESRSGVMVGDEVVVWARGTQPVRLRMAKRDDAGERVGAQRLRGSRTIWTVEKPRYVEALRHKAEIVRGVQMHAGAALETDPELAVAFAGLRLAAQFARALTPREDDQARIVEAIRAGLAHAIARGDRIRLPDARAHGRTAPPRARSGAPVHDEAPARA